eukprot:c15345_g1_i1 orf=95-808(+)
MAWRQADLDLVLVPAGMLLLLIYHAQLVYRILKFPTTTVIGINLINRQAWVRKMMEEGSKVGVLAVQTLRNNMMASTLLATAAIALSSLIAVMVSSNGSAAAPNSLVVGDKSALTSAVKLLSVLVCFLVAFLCNVQSIRYYSHVSFLISIPIGEDAPGLTPDYVSRALTRGSNFWSLGLRSFYFSFPLFLWIFGPVPMFVCSIVMVVVLHFLDTAKEFKQTFHTVKGPRISANTIQI